MSLQLSVVMKKLPALLVHAFFGGRAALMLSAGES